MENITHTLIGFAIAESAVQSRLRAYPEKPAHRALLWTISAVAGNLPDLDVLLGIHGGGRLGYLLQHRGYTHTLALVVPEALLTLFVARLFFYFRRRNRSWDSTILPWALFVTLVGPIVHIALDSLNSYGVHPFWPWNNRWYYGDSVFIVEPLIWLAVLPSLLLGRWAFLGWAFFGATLLLPWLTAYIPWPAGLILDVFGLAWCYLVRKMPEIVRGVLGVYGFVGVILFFAVTSAEIRKTVRRHLANGPTKTVDIVLSPMPANPLCWTLLTVETNPDGATYRVRSGLYLPLGNRLREGWSCSRLRAPERGTLLSPAVEDPDPRFRWAGEYVGNLAELRRARDQYCAVAALLRFVRVPFVVAVGNGVKAGDLRYHHPRRGSFAEVQVSGADDQCPSVIPPWRPPREDLLR